MSDITVLNTDVLVIGGGFAGLWTAKKAREYVEDVLWTRAPATGAGRGA